MDGTLGQISEESWKRIAGVYRKAKQTKKPELCLSTERSLKYLQNYKSAESILAELDKATARP